MIHDLFQKQERKAEAQCYIYEFTKDFCLLNAERPHKTSDDKSTQHNYL